MNDPDRDLEVQTSSRQRGTYQRDCQDYIVCCILKQHVETPECILCVVKGCIEAKLINTTSTTWNDLSTRTPQFRVDYHNGIVGIVISADTLTPQSIAVVI